LKKKTIFIYTVHKIKKWGLVEYECDSGECAAGGQIVSRAWMLAGSDYNGVVFFTGKENFTDGDGRRNNFVAEPDLIGSGSYSFRKNLGPEIIYIKQNGLRSYSLLLVYTFNLLILWYFFKY